MTSDRRAVLVLENSDVPLDVRVWSEALTLRDAGWQVTIICPDIDEARPGKTSHVPAGVPEDLDGVAVYRFPLTVAQRGVSSYLKEYTRAFLSIARLSRQVWRDAGFDVIHFSNPPDVFFPIAAYYRSRGVSVVFDHHDLFPEVVSWRYHGPIGKLLYGIARASEFLTFRSAHVVVSTNQSYRQIAIERGKVNAERVFVVRNGPRRDEFVPLASVPALKKDFPHMACYAGMMGYEDGVLELVRSIRCIVQDLGRRDIRFVMMGDGAMRAEALASVRDLGLEPYVELPGMIRDKVLLRQYLCTADVLLSPEPLTDLNDHSTFVKIGEYMAMGKPIVAYDLTETRYTGGEAIVYVEPGDESGFGRAVVDLIDDPQRRQRLGELGRRRFLDHLTWEHQQDELLRAYSVALAR